MLGLVFLYAFQAFADDRVKILVLGDSLTAGYGLSEAHSFPVKLQDRLIADGIDAEVINAGVSGDTTAGGLARIGWLLGSDLPDFVIIELGANDGLRGLEPASTRANLKAIVEVVQAKGLPVLIAGMLAPPNLGPDYAADFNPIFPDVAKETGSALYPFFLEGVAAEPALNQSDGIHPNAEGVGVIVEMMTPPILEWISANRP